MTMLTHKERQDVIEHYKRGLTLREIAGFYDMSHEGVRGILLRACVKMKPQHKPYDRRAS